MADMFGRKNLYGSGFAVFTLGSFLSGLSQPQFHGRYLVGYRLVRGIGGSLLFTNSAAIVTDAFRTGRVGLGLVVGGTLTSFSWSWILMVNVPLGIFGTLWGMRRLRGPVSLPKAQQFDWMGLLTFTLGLGSLLLVVSLIAFPLIDTVYIYLLFGLAVLGLGAFFIVELGVKQPLLDFRLFEDKLSAYASLASA